MKKILFATFVALLLCSCGNGDPDLQYFPFQSERDGKWGMISADGDVLFEGEFKSECELSVAMRDRFWVKYEGDDGYYFKLFAADKKPYQVGNTKYSQAGDFVEKVAPVVKKNGGIMFIDRDGNEAFRLEKVGGKKVEACSNFINGYAIFKTENNRMGLINPKGEVVIEPKKYVAMGFVSNGRLLAIDKKYEDADADERKVTIIAIPSGEEISTFAMSKFDDFGNMFRDDRLPAEKPDKGWGFINDKAEWVMPANSKVKRLYNVGSGSFNRNSWFNGDLCVFKGEDGEGILDIGKGEVVLKAKYEDLIFADNSGKLLWAENEDGRWNLINTEGEVVADVDAREAYPFFGSVAFVRDGDHSWIAVGKDGKDQKVKDLNGRPLDIFNIEISSLEDYFRSEKE